MVLLGSSLEVFAEASFLGFEPKYLEIQFGVSAFDANIITGLFRKNILKQILLIVSVLFEIRN